jgi:STAM-binding protein
VSTGRYPSPIITTTSPPRETGHFASTPIAYPTLMSNHQKDQGYQPSSQSIFAQTGPQEEDTPQALLFQPLGVKEFPPKSDPTKWPSSRSMNPSSRPLHASNMPSRSPYAEYTGTAGPPPAPPFSHLLHGHSRSGSSVTPRLRQVMLPVSTLPRFLSIAAVNTAQKRETCGLLLGKHVGNSFRISTLLIPKQTATENSCSMTHEELVAQFQLTRDLITLGWVNLRPYHFVSVVEDYAS